MNPLTIALKNDLIKNLEKAGAFKKGKFILTSGATTEYYVDCRPALLNSYRMASISSAWVHALRQFLTTDHVLCGVPTSGLIMVAALLQKLTTHMEIESCYVRLGARTHGTWRAIEGNPKKNAKIIVLDDVGSTGTTMLKTIQILGDNGHRVFSAATILDRSEGRILQRMKQMDVPYFSLLTMKDVEDLFHET